MESSGLSSILNPAPVGFHLLEEFFRLLFGEVTHVGHVLCRSGNMLLGGRIDFFHLRYDL